MAGGPAFLQQYSLVPGTQSAPLVGADVAAGTVKIGSAGAVAFGNVAAVGTAVGTVDTSPASATVSINDAAQGGSDNINLVVTQINANTTMTNLQNVQVNVVEGGTGQTSTTAYYDPTGGTGAGALTVTLANNAPVTAADITAALNTLGSDFTNNFSAVANATNGTSVATPPTQVGTNLSIAQGTTSGGQYAITGDNATLTGGTVGGTFSGGTGSSASPGLQGNLVLEIGGALGNQQLSFTQGELASAMVTAIKGVTALTGVTASVNGNGALQFNSQDYGSKAFVNVKVISDTDPNGTFAASLLNAQSQAATHATGTDIQATVNNEAATGSGNTVSLDSANLSFSATLANTVGANTAVDFNITGGGALFQLGAVVTANQQARLGIQNVDTSSLGGTAGYLYQIGSGQTASLTSNASTAGQIVQEALNQVTALRGQLGAFQTATLDTNISTLTGAVTNLTAAQSDIQDADFASESASLTQQQILVQSGTTVLGIANSNPQNVLALLQKASQV